MAELGSHLFAYHLVAIEVVGTLLLVALVGAIAIVIQGRKTQGHGSAGTTPSSNSAQLPSARGSLPGGSR